ncbi:MAG TPA: hypothetical protein VMV72_04755 [Verrucomicrobiae bacterium]|nr:hypothetical protein [Verrucomicrobiae bacterium]
MLSVRMLAYVIQVAVLLLLVFVVPLGPNRHWIIFVYIVVSLTAIRLIGRG